MSVAAAVEVSWEISLLLGNVNKVQKVFIPFTRGLPAYWQAGEMIGHFKNDNTFAGLYALSDLYHTRSWSLTYQKARAAQNITSTQCSQFIRFSHGKSLVILIRTDKT